MKISKVRLRNLGYRYIIELENGQIIEIIDFLNGKKEIYVVEDNKIKNLVSLTEEEAREIGLILADLHKEEELTPLVRDKVLMDWFIVKKGFFAANKKIKDLKIRTKTGASIVAIERKDNLISNITPETEIKEGDKVLIVGPLSAIEKAKRIMLKGE